MTNQSPMELVKRDIHADVLYAYGWFANLAMTIYDTGIELTKARKSANNIMKLFFDYDMLEHMEEYERKCSEQARSSEWI